jgi:hypothetical protein
MVMQENLLLWVVGGPAAVAHVMWTVRRSGFIVHYGRLRIRILPAVDSRKKVHCSSCTCGL